MTLESGIGDFKALEEVLSVYTELGGEAEPELEDLVSPYRSAVSSYEVLMREAPFASSESDEAKVFVLNDILLVALSTRKAGKSARQKRMGTLDKKKKKGTLEIRKGTLTKFKAAYKLLHYLDLTNCSVKDSGENAQGFSVVTLTHVHRMRQATSGRKKNGTFKIVTRIAKMELCFPTRELAEGFLQSFVDAVKDLEDLDEEGADSASQGSRYSLSRQGSVSSIGTDSTGTKQRKWASNRVRRTTLEKSTSAAAGSSVRGGSLHGGSVHGGNGMGPGGGPGGASVASSPRLSRHGSTASFGESSVGGDSISGGLQLSDLEQRYNVDLKTEGLEGEDGKTEVEVEFGEGRMGLSLGSGPGIGVIVGALAPGGFAELAGVLISDRVLSVNEEEVGVDDSWQEVLEKLKTYERPITVKFQRFASRTQHLGTKALKKAGKAKDKGSESTGIRKAKGKELQRILDKTDRIVTRAETLTPVLVNLLDSADVRGSEARRNATQVLTEIYRTEITYVADLRSLMKTYVLPLRNARVKKKCRDIPDASLVCDHGLVRGTCPRSAKQLQPLVSADDLKGIFLNIETLMFVNVELLRLLQNKLQALQAGGKKPSLEDVMLAFADSFHKVMPFFKLYSDFCFQYSTAVDSLLLLRGDNAKLDGFLKEAERTAAKHDDPSRRVLSLGSLLIKPVQRVCKYPLLFGEILKHAEGGHGALASSSKKWAEGIEALEKTAFEVERIAASVNRNVGESKAFEEFMEVYAALGGEAAVPDLVVPSRRFIGQADLMVRETPFSSATARPRTLFIFNDMLILAKGDGNTLSKQRSLKRNSLSRVASTVSLARRNSLDEPSLGRSIGRFFSSIFGGEEDVAATGRKQSSQGGSMRGGRAKARHYKPMHRFELERVEMGDVATGADKAGMPEYSFVLTCKERVLESESPGGRRGNKSASGSAGGTGKVKTNINKYKLSFDDKPYMEEVYARLDEQLAQLKSKNVETQKGKTQYGVKKEKRNWAKKTNGTLKARVRQTSRTTLTDDDDSSAS